MYIIIYYDVLVTTTKVLVTLLIASRVRPQAMTKLYTIIAITPVGCKYWHAPRAKLQNKYHYIIMIDTISFTNEGRR
jgi:hypothetical protein